MPTFSWIFRLISSKIANKQGKDIYNTANSEFWYIYTNREYANSLIKSPRITKATCNWFQNGMQCGKRMGRCDVTTWLMAIESLSKVNSTNLTQKRKTYPFVVIFTNILRSAFATISLSQKITHANCKRINVAQNTFEWKCCSYNGGESDTCYN